MQKKILITGATDGIGLLAAQKLSELGQLVLLHGRNPAKLEAAQKTLSGPSHVYCADLSDMNAVTKLAGDVRADHDQLDVLINNAGVLKSANTKTPSGRDIRFDVNTVAPYILTLKLLPMLGKNGRIINLSSAAQAPVDTGAFQTFRPMQDMDAYAQSKLAITIWSSEMARQNPNGPVFVSVNPGSLLASKMVKEGFGIAGNDLNIGADILVDAATGDPFADASGRYFDNDSGQFAQPHAAASDQGHVASVMETLSKIAEPHLI